MRQGKATLLAAAVLLPAVLAGPVLAQPRADAGFKVGVVDVGKLLEESGPGRKRVEDLKVLRLDQNERSAALASELEKIKTQLSEERLSLAADQLAQLQKTAEDKQIELDRYTVDATREFEANQKRMLQDIEAMLKPIIDAVGAEQGYAMIFRKYDSGLIYMSDAVDITGVVMERLNQHEAASDGSSSGAGR